MTIYDRAMEDGMQKGMEPAIKAMQRILLQAGSRLIGQASPDVESKIRSVQDFDLLVLLNRRVWDVQSWDELLTGRDPVPIIVPSSQPNEIK